MYRWIIIILLILTTKQTEIKIKSVNKQITTVTNNKYVDNLKQKAVGYIGIKYKYGTKNKYNTDCSGLICMIYDDKIPRTTKQMIKIGNKITIDSLETGDLLFFQNRKKTKVGHVAFYYDNNLIIHATSKGVIMDSIGNNNWKHYWSSRYIETRRI